MKFTKYIWDLYKVSEKGRKETSFFGKNNISELSEKFDFKTERKYEDDNGNLITEYLYKEMFDELEKDKITNLSEARELYDQLIIRWVKKTEYNYFFEDIGTYTTSLYHKFPEYFLPYYFTMDNYPIFLNLCENFGIDLPSNPPRNNKEKRTWFYFDVCQTLHNFRRKHNISTDEFPAFLYCFGLNSLEKQEETELPKPSRIYFLGAGGQNAKEEDNWDFQFLDNSNTQSTDTWAAGGLKIKKGDLVLTYCLSPRKYLHSIWKALEDSFIDPFSYYYYGVKFGFPKKIEHVSFQELKNNHVFKNNPTVRAHMQGLNGRPLTVKEYSELLNIIEEKGQSTNNLPKLPMYDRGLEHIENERDVELQLIEPLLKDLNFKEKDWIRQLPIKMGRQTSYYPDYAILVSKAKGKEKAKIVLEAKYSISSDKQLEEDFNQVRSYGLRLQAEKVVLADRDFIWIFEKSNGDFQLEWSLKFHWNDLTNSDNLYKLNEILRKK